MELHNRAWFSLCCLPFALPIIRIGVGVTLVILALDEKLLHPGLSVAFLKEHHLNFMPLLVLGPVELVGHAPLFGIALLLVVQGAGAWRLAPSSKSQRVCSPAFVTSDGAVRAVE